MSVTCRTASGDEVALMLDWAAAEGWNPGLEDAAAFRAADPEGFFVAELAGQVVAAISVVDHSDAVAFLGLYLCRPEFRGRGIGRTLWRHALAHAGDRAVGLDGVPAQEANYARAGFVRQGATIRFEGALPAGTDCAVRPACNADAVQLARLDRAACGVDRPRFLATWMAEAATRRTVICADGRGFATARLCRDGAKIGPVVAEEAGTALDLIAAAGRAVGATRLIVDLPEARRGLAGLLVERGFAPGFTTARMWRGAPPVAGASQMAIASMELG